MTTILGCIGKAALINWAASVERTMCVEAAADLYEDLSLVPPGKRMSRPAYIATMQARLGRVKASKKELEKAAEIGSQAHALVEWNIRRMMGQEPGPEPRCCDKAMWAFMACEDWLKQVNMKPIAIEQVVFSMTHQYAGTMDLLAEVTNMGKRQRALIDWKTSKAVYPESYLQNAAYQIALTEMGHGPVDCGIIVRLPKNENDPEFEAIMVPPAETLFPVFLNVYGLWKWQYENEKEYQAKREKEKEEAA